MRCILLLRGTGRRPQHRRRLRRNPTLTPLSKRHASPERRQKRPL